MPPLAEYLRRVDELMQEVIRAYGKACLGDAAAITAEFRALGEKALFYEAIKRTVDNHREHGILSHQVEAEEQAAKRAFAEAYKAYYEKHDPPT